MADRCPIRSHCPTWTVVLGACTKCYPTNQLTHRILEWFVRQPPLIACVRLGAAESQKRALGRFCADAPLRGKRKPAPPCATIFDWSILNRSQVVCSGVTVLSSSVGWLAAHAGGSVLTSSPLSAWSGLGSPPGRLRGLEPARLRSCATSRCQRAKRPRVQSRAARQGRAQRAAKRCLLVCWVRMLRSEVEVLSRGPDRGNPPSMRQGRGPELTGRFQCGWLRCEAPARAGLKEAIDALWWRTRVKRRKALLGGRAGQRRRCPIPVMTEHVLATRSQRNLSISPQEICWVSAMCAGRPEDARTMVDGPAEVRGLRSTGRRGNAR